MGGPVKRLEVLELFELGETLLRSTTALAPEKVKVMDAYFALSGAEGAFKNFRG